MVKNDTLRRKQISLGEIKIVLVDQQRQPASFIDGKSNNGVSPVSVENDISSAMVSGPVLHDPHKELLALKRCHQASPKPGQTWYAVASRWVQKWLVCEYIYVCACGKCYDSTNGLFVLI